MRKENTYGLGSSTKRKGSSYKWLYLPFVVLLAIAGMSYATQNAASSLAYQSALGHFWFIWNEIPWYAPWSIFIWMNKWPEHYALFDPSITLGQAIFLVPQFVILGCWFARRRLHGNKDLHGSARWADKEDIEKMGYLNNSEGVYIGGWLQTFTTAERLKRTISWLFRLLFCPFLLLLSVFRKKQAKANTLSHYIAPPRKEVHHYLRDNDNKHLMVFAPTRSGKGVGLILPTLLSWKESTVVLDIKGENWALTSGWCTSIGNTTLRFDPSDASGAGACFNPLEEISLHTLLAIQETQNLAMMLIDPEGKGLSDHWTKAAFAFFSGIVLHCCVMTPEREKRSATLSDLVLMMADETRTTEELLEEMLETDHAALLQARFPEAEGAEHVHTFIASSAREMMNKDEKEASGVLSSALVNLALYRDPIIAMNTEKSDFKISDLMNHDKPVNLYLVVSPADIDRVRPLIRLIVDMIVRKVCQKMEFADGASMAGYKHRLLFMLDELTSLGKLPVIEKVIAFMAGYGGRMFLVVQDTIQLNNVYGKENALMSNCHVRIAYAPNLIETAKMLSEMTGKATVIDTKTSLSGSRLGSMKNASLSVSETARPLLTPDECMRIPGLTKDSSGKPIPGDMLIFTAGQPTIYGKQILYFIDPTFSARAKIKASGVSSRFPSGITHSLYYPRPQEWFSKEELAPDNSVALSFAVHEDIETFFE